MVRAGLRQELLQYNQQLYVIESSYPDWINMPPGLNCYWYLQGVFGMSVDSVRDLTNNNWQPFKAGEGRTILIR